MARMGDQSHQGGAVDVERSHERQFGEIEGDGVIGAFRRTCRAEWEDGYQDEDRRNGQGLRPSRHLVAMTGGAQVVDAHRPENVGHQPSQVVRTGECVEAELHRVYLEGPK